MDLIYTSTRNSDEKATASQAILKGLAGDGGLFVPDSLPKLDVDMDTLAKMSYQETAYEVMKLFLTDFTEEELKHCINSAYDSKFDTEEIAPLVDADGAYYLELFHGATIAFKDMALSILPYLMTTAAKKNHVKNEIVILTATSGDTGKAALAGFADVPGTKIIVFYPKNGVSPIQEKQMVTQKGANTHVVGIHGNFDQAQTGVKKMFSDKELAELMDKAKCTGVIVTIRGIFVYIICDSVGITFCNGFINGSVAVNPDIPLVHINEKYGCTGGTEGVAVIVFDIILSRIVRIVINGFKSNTSVSGNRSHFFSKGSFFFVC